MAQTNGPLDGLRILDLTRIMAGPTCTQLLGDMGADVIKVERPGLGDDTRAWGPPYVKDENGNDTSESAYFLSANRNKRSVSIDFSDPKDVEKLKSLLNTCDVFVENFKLGGLKKYGLDYETLAKEFPKLVYCSITGFGQTGPNAAKAGYDLMIQGYAGIMSLTGEPDGQPMKVGVAIADVVTGLYASNAILAALRHVSNTGEGQHIDLALADTQMSWLINQGTNYLCSGQEPKRYGNEHPNIVPYQVFEAKDGFMILAVGNDRQFQDFCAVIGQAEWALDPRFSTNSARLAHRDVLIPMIGREFLAWGKTDLISRLEDKAVPCGPINTLGEVFATDQASARDMVVQMEHPMAGTGQVSLIGNPIKFSKTPVSYRCPPPFNGQHNNDVFGDDWD